MQLDYSFDKEEEEGATRLCGWLDGDSLAPPCQSDMDVVYAILQLAHEAGGICATDTLFDLGCGDGRICIEAARLYGCAAVGCEIEEDLVAKFRRNVLARGLEGRVRVLSADLRDVDVSGASIVVLYLLPEAVAELTPMLQRVLAAGGRVICNTWGPKGWTPTRRVACGPSNNVTLLLYNGDCAQA